jgi:hypothetical protein
VNQTVILKTVNQKGITDILTRVNFCVDDFFDGCKVDKDIFRGQVKTMRYQIKYMEKEK